MTTAQTLFESCVSCGFSAIFTERRGFPVGSDPAGQEAFNFSSQRNGKAASRMQLCASCDLELCSVQLANIWNLVAKAVI